MHSYIHVSTLSCSSALSTSFWTHAHANMPYFVRAVWGWLDLLVLVHNDMCRRICFQHIIFTGHSSGTELLYGPLSVSLRFFKIMIVLLRCRISYSPLNYYLARLESCDYTFRTLMIHWTLSWCPWKCSAGHNHQQLVLECVFCSSDVIHMPCNILGYHLVWPFRFMAVSVCGRFGCGRSGLWPFRFVVVPVVAVSVCGRYDLLPHVWFNWRHIILPPNHVVHDLRIVISIHEYQQLHRCKRSNIIKKYLSWFTHNKQNNTKWRTRHSQHSR